MKSLFVKDNSKKTFNIDSHEKDVENLRKVGNRTFSDLQREDSGVLVFPPKLEDTNDKIKDEVIFRLKETEKDFELETGNIMGFLGRNNTQLNICSRFVSGDSEESDFFIHYMLEKVCHVNLVNLKSTSSPDKIFDFLPFLFPQYLISALKQGLYKEYQTHEYNDSNVRGVIDINRHIRFNIPANGKVAYHTREYSFDNPVTELVRHTIEYIRSNSMFKQILTGTEETKDAVSKIDNATPLYNRMERNKILSKTMKPIKSPYFNKYRDLQKICRMILLREKIKYDSSKNQVYGILFDGAWLWEEYLATLLKQKGFVHPENKKCSGVIHPFSNTSIGNFYPDFYRARTDIQLESDYILDAKYKCFDFKNPPADDLQQMIAYIHIMNADKGKFIYPSTNTNKETTPWELKAFSGKIAEMGTIPFLIPQNANNYDDFKKQIKNSEMGLIV